MTDELRFELLSGSWKGYEFWLPEWMKEKKPEGRTKNIAPESKLKEPKWVNKPTEVSTEKKKK